MAQMKFYLCGACRKSWSRVEIVNDKRELRCPDKGCRSANQLIDVTAWENYRGSFRHPIGPATTAERIRRGVRKYLAASPQFAMIDGERYQIVDMDVMPVSAVVTDLTIRQILAEDTGDAADVQVLNLFPFRPMTSDELVRAQSRIAWTSPPCQHYAGPNRTFPDPTHRHYFRAFMTPQLIEDKMHTDNMNRWLETEALKDGSENQRERYAAGVLPEEELTHLARAKLFAGFDAKRWSSRDLYTLEKALKHLPKCLEMDRGPHCPDPPVGFETAEATEISAEEWKALSKIEAAADVVRKHEWLARSGGAVTIERLAHWATCPDCKAEEYRSTAKVSILWAGRTLVREYAL